MNIHVKTHQHWSTSALLSVAWRQQVTSRECLPHKFSAKNLRDPTHLVLELNMLNTGHVGWMENGDGWGSIFMNKGWMGDEWMRWGYNSSPIHPHWSPFIEHKQSTWGWMGDEWIGWGYYSSPVHPLFIPARDEWVKVDPHSSPFPIHPTCPVNKASDGDTVPRILTPYEG